MASIQNRTVCVVDDDEAVRDSMRALLESHGMIVRDYASARAFLADADDAPVECFLLDLHMPEMSGLDLLETLRLRHIETPVIVITGRSDVTLRERARRAGVLAFLDKPVDEDELILSISMAFPDATP